MDHKEKCRRLKAIRKKVADTIGLDLHQTECTFEGECKGTCPKCAQEEKRLNAALLGGTACAAAALLTACGMEKQSSGHESHSNNTLIENIASVFDKSDDYAGDIEMTGDEAPPIDDYDGGLEYYDPDTITVIDDGSIDEYDPELAAGELEYDPNTDSLYCNDNNNNNNGNDEIYELDGDVAIAGPDLTDENTIIIICQNYSQAPIVEIDHMDGNNYIVHCYEIVDDGNGESHTATYDWITVDPDNYTMTNFIDEEIDFYQYYVFN